MNIQIFDKFTFDRFLTAQSINDVTVEAFKRTCFISINDSFGTSEEPHFKENHSNVLNLFFDDIEYDITVKDFDSGSDIVVKCFSDDQAKEVVNFIINNKGKEQCWIHCTAGISRSGAIGKFIAEFTKSKMPQKRISPNPTVYKKLNDYIIINNVRY